MALAALTSCSIQESEVLGDGNSKTIVFYGEAFPQTKTSIGSPEDGKYPVLWSAGDQIGIYGMNIGFLNEAATLDDGSAGYNSGIFVLNTTEQVAVDAQDLVIYYPYSTGTEYSDGALHSVIPYEQKQARPGDSGHTGKYALAYAKSAIEDADADGNNPPVQFSLTHAVAYVKFVVSGGSFSSWKLNGVSLYSEGAHITGDISANVTTGEVTGAYQRDHAVVTVEETADLSQPQEIWMVTAPCDLTGKETVVSVSMTDGSVIKTIPMKMNLGQLEANAVNVIPVTVDDSKVAADFPWYETDETRELAAGWAYGPENTYIFTESGQEMILDVKARGYYIGIEEPKKVNIMIGDNNLAGRGCLEAETSKPGSWWGAPDFVDLGADYTVRVKVLPENASISEWFGKIGIADENNEYLWAITIWYVPGGVQEEQYRTAVVMDRMLGGRAPQADDNKCYGAYFQWGRPFPFSWGSGTFGSAATTARDLKQSARNVDKVLFYKDVENANGDWWLGDQTGARSDRKDDFWGNPNNGTGAGSAENGVKTVFDPCPVGWMVASPAVIKEFVAGRDADVTSGSVMKWLTYKYDDTNTSYWPLGGYKDGSDAGNGGSNLIAMTCWSNSPYAGYGSSDHKAYCYTYNNNLQKSEEEYNRAYGFNVRCMKVQ